MENLSPVRKWSILAILSLGLLIIILDTTLLNVSLAAIIRDLHTTIQGFQWVITGYTLTMAALTITGGRLGDLFGRKKMFMTGAVIFAIGSFITSISQNVPTMIAGEAIIEGIGAALMMPATMSLLVSNFKGRDRAIGFGVWGAIASVGAAIGPVVGGWLTTYSSWRWGFRINIVVALILVIGALFIPESRDKEEKPSLDMVGVILSATGLLAFVFGIIESSTYGWWRAKQLFTLGGISIDVNGLSIVPFALLIGTILLTIFVLWEQVVDNRGDTPLVSMRLFQNRQFTSGALLTSIMALGQSGIIFTIPVFLQSVRKLDALHTGYSLLPMSLTLLVASPAGAMLAGKIRPKPIIQFGLLLNILAAFILRQSFSVEATSSSFILPLALFGAGMGIMMSQISNVTLSAVSTQEAGEASGVNSTMRQIGQTLGSAIIGAVLLGALTTNLSQGITQSAVIPEVVKPQLVDAVSKQTSNVEFGDGAELSNDIPPAIAEEIIRISHQATVDANKSSLNYGILFAVLGVLASFTLPNIGPREIEQEKSVASGGH